MFVARIILALGVAIAIGGLALYVFTGDKTYLKFMGRAALVALAVLLIMGVGMVAGRFFGLLL